LCNEDTHDLYSSPDIVLSDQTGEDEMGGACGMSERRKMHHPAQDKTLNSNSLYY